MEQKVSRKKQSRQSSAYLRRGKTLNRTVGSRGAPKQSFLIVCEGTRTEPNYFKAFRVRSATVEVKGSGYNTRSLVEYTKNMGFILIKYGVFSIEMILPPPLMLQFKRRKILVITSLIQMRPLNCGISCTSSILIPVSADMTTSKN